MQVFAIISSELLALHPFLPTIAPHMGLTRKRILCIEDNPDIISLIKLVLRQAPAEVVDALTADEAWPKMEAAPPDLILLDMMLPGMSGLDFLARLRADSRFAPVPVIIVSIRSDLSYRRRAQELGITRYLLKPFSPAVLRAEVEQALNVDWTDYWVAEPDKRENGPGH
jgi:two-component system phosphate regulon response regulator PhoB